MSENGEIYTAGKNFTLPPALTALTNSTSGSYISVFWQRVNIQIALPYRNPQQHKSKAAIWRNQEDIEKLKYTSNPCCGKSYVERIEKKSGQRIPVVMHRRKTMIGNTCCNGWLARGSNHLQIRAGKLGLLVLEVHSTSEPGTKSKSFARQQIVIIAKWFLGTDLTWLYFGCICKRTWPF